MIPYHIISYNTLAHHITTSYHIISYPISYHLITYDIICSFCYYWQVRVPEVSQNGAKRAQDQKDIAERYHIILYYVISSYIMPSYTNSYVSMHIHAYFISHWAQWVAACPVQGSWCQGAEAFWWEQSAWSGNVWEQAFQRCLLHRSGTPGPETS